MAALEMTVGKNKIQWLTLPKGNQGEAQVQINGAPATTVKYRIDSDGVQLDFGDRVVAFDLFFELNDESQPIYEISKRLGNVRFSGVQSDIGSGTSQSGGAHAKKKSGAKIKAQMPGKIVKLLVTEGEMVQKDQPLIVMEAMKMENEIRSPIAGKIISIKTAVGSNVDSGAELIRIE